MARPGRLRRLAPLAALLVPTVLLGVAAAIWSLWPCGESLCARPLSTVWLLVLLALPTAVLVGLPWTASGLTVGLAVATSAVVWMALGAWAAARATSDVDAGWRHLWLELAFLAFGVWAGLVGGLGALAWVLTR